MSISNDIARMYLRPRQVVRARLAQGQREDRALAVLMGACGLIFVAQWPRLAREAHLDDTIGLQALMAGALMGWVFIMPLALYGLAALSHLVATAVGGQGTWFRARLALFWALLAASPLWLFHGLVAGFIGPGPALTFVGLLALGAFVVFWGIGLAEAEGQRQRT
ncbi:MAG: YIP1 family protein [Paracoccaceae bacterium]|nr:YIP1 family protein [Paracoccaceae bacterium]